MAYDELLAIRIRAALTGESALQEKKMFGGVGFLLHGNMACGIHNDELIVRVGPAQYAVALARPHAHPFDMTGKPMTGWISVSPAGFASEADLQDWLRQGVDFAHTLPPK